jgi:Trk K+ transport system NAD-binding subunit
MLAKKRPAVPDSERRNIIELTVTSGSAVDGKYIGRIHWPAHVALVDIKRGSSELVPDIDTRLHTGDYIYVLTDSVEGAEAVRNLVEQEKT